MAWVARLQQRDRVALLELRVLLVLLLRFVTAVLFLIPVVGLPLVQLLCGRPARVISLLRGGVGARWRRRPLGRGC